MGERDRDRDRERDRQTDRETEIRDGRDIKRDRSLRKRERERKTKG